MNLYSPDRPTVASGRPALLGWSCAVPHLMLMPGEDASRIRIVCHLPVAFNTFGFAQTTVPIDRIQELLEAYRNDPEDTLKTLFGWNTIAPIIAKPPRAAAPVPIIDPEWTTIEHLI